MFPDQVFPVHVLPLHVFPVHVLPLQVFPDHPVLDQVLPVQDLAVQEAPVHVLPLHVFPVHVLPRHTPAPARAGCELTCPGGAVPRRAEDVPLAGERDRPLHDVIRTAGVLE